MNSLLTGIGGFAGGHLARHLLHAGYAVRGTFRSSNPSRELPGDIELFHCDMGNARAVDAAIEAAPPDVIFHLAAQTSESEHQKDPAGAYLSNAAGTEHLLAAVVRYAPAATVLIAGSSAEYGFVKPDENPIRESNPTRPLTAYGVSKLAQSFVGLRFALAHQLRVIRVRAFNYTGPGQGEGFVVPTLCRQIARIERGIQPPVLSVGNLEARRDFTDVRDVVRAYRLAAEMGAPGEIYNVCAGRAWRIGDLLDQLLGLTDTKPAIERAAHRVQVADAPLQIGDASTIAALTGWRPQIPMDATLRDTLTFWREKVAKGG